MTRELGGQTPSNVTQYLKGMDFPAQKEDLVQQAKKNGASQDILSVIQKMPEHDYESMADVMKDFQSDKKQQQ